ncbi:MAG: hypothetical protein IKF14_04470 [Atopobiaceae bacterium]|nr:hypothetical protein [Atopobiaceae bacterium]
MRAPSYADCFQVLLLQLSDEGRKEVLLGDAVDRARMVCLPFIVGKKFPDVYFEFPLAGDPFLDTTLLYEELEPGTHIDSPAAGDVQGLLDWFGPVRHEHPNVSFGFELDTSKLELPKAALHFQPRTLTELVRPFCELAGEPERADLYLNLAARMPEGWPLSFFGMFRGRPNSPLRVCGYLPTNECDACVADPRHLAEVFDAIGFTAYDDAMLIQVSQLMGVAPSGVDFQFDVYPDGHLGDVFAIDTQYGIERPEAVRSSFAQGPAEKVMSLLQLMGAADERWKLAPGAAFARAIPVTLDDGTPNKLAFTLMPQWSKARWRAGELQPAKLYYLGKASFTSIAS